MTSDPDRLRFDTVDELAAVQEALAVQQPPPWSPPARPLVVAGCFVAFARGEAGPGHPGDRAWAGAVLVDEDGRRLAEVAVTGTAPHPYEVGLLARREGPVLLAAVQALADVAPEAPDVVLVDATGRDHPRRAGLAVHLGAVVGLPTVGVTHRGLVGRVTAPPPLERGERVDVVRDGEAVAAWVGTSPGTRPVLAHAGWCTDVDTAVAVVLRTTHPGARSLPGGTAGRTPEPLRQARQVARLARAAADAASPDPTASDPPP